MRARFRQLVVLACMLALLCAVLMPGGASVAVLVPTWCLHEQNVETARRLAPRAVPTTDRFASSLPDRGPPSV